MAYRFVPGCFAPNVLEDIIATTDVRLNVPLGDGRVGALNTDDLFAAGQADQRATDVAEVEAAKANILPTVTILGVTGTLDTSVYAADQLATDVAAVEAVKDSLLSTVTLLGVTGTLDLSLYTLISGVAVPNDVRFGTPCYTDGPLGKMYAMPETSHTSGKRFSETRELLYKLKRDYGLPATLYKVSYGSTNWQTGKKNVTRTKIEISNLVILPPKSFFLQVTVQSGGFVQTNVREVLLDMRDLPGGYKLEDSDYFVINAKRYNIVYHNLLDNQQGYYLHLQETNNEPPYQIIDTFFKERLTVGENHAR